MLLALVALAAWPASATAVSNPVLAGAISDSATLPGTTSVAVSGHYAYTTGYYAGELTAIDISNPASPTIAGSSAPSNALLDATTVNVAGGYAYVVSKNRNGPQGSGRNDDGTGNSLTILDITSDPAHPAIIGSITDANTLFGAYGVAISGHYAYVAAQGCLSGQPCPNASVGSSFAVIDISLPSTPTIVGAIHNSALPAPWTGSGALAHATAVAISGNYAYVTAAYSNRLTVIDISNPLSPKIVASIQDATNLNFPVDVTVSGNYAWVVDQISTGRLTAVDISNPTNPQVVASLANSWLNGAYRVRTRGAFAFVSANSGHAVATADISNPLAPRLAAGFYDPNHLYRTTGVDVDSSGRYAIATSPLLSSQSQPAYPPYALQPGGPTITGSVSVVTLDPVPISVSITAASKPPNPTAQTSANFAFTTNDTVAAMQCRLDGVPYAPCTSATGQQYNALSAGSHTFAVQASDPAGDTSTASYTWSVTAPVNTAPPTISGSPVAGQVLTATTGSWTGSPWFTYQWLRCDGSGANCASISGANAATYTVQGADASSTLRVQVTGTSTAGATAATSAATAVVTSAPANTTAPVISGTAQPGAQLSASSGTWTGYPAPSFSYQWQRCDQSGQNCSSITGATSSTYTVTAADAGSTLQVVVTGSNSAGSSSASSAVTAVVQGPPQNTVPPTVSGTATQGSQLTASPGTWSGYPAPTFSYQWQRCDQNGQNCSMITGATSTTYTIANADAGFTLQVVVTGTNTAGSASASSAVTAVVTAAPANQSPPTISGTATQGQTLTGSAGTWSGYPAPSLSYQWWRCDQNGQNCSSIAGATSTTYTLVGADVGSTVEFVVAATNSAGTAAAASQPSAVVAPSAVAPQNTSPPTVSGTATQGSQLTASPGTWSGYPAPTFSYQWQRCDQSGQNCSSITGATGSTYTATAADVGSTLQVGVTGTNSAGSSSASSAVTAVVTGAPVNQSPPTISGTTTQGHTLTGSAGTWSGYPAPSFAYQWQRCDQNGQNCSSIAGATSTTYTLVGADVGSTVELVVTATNSAGSAPASSSASAVIAGPPVNTAAPTISGAATEAQTLREADGSWSGYPAPTFSYQWQRCNASGQSCAPIPGATASSYALVAADVGSTVVVAVTASNSAGSQSVSSAATAVVSSAPGPVTSQLDNFARPDNTGPPGPSWSHMPVSSSSSTNDLYITGQQATGKPGSNGDYWNPQSYGPDSEAWITVATKPNVDLDPVVLGVRFQNPSATTASGYQAFYIYRSSGTDQYKITVRTNGTSVTTLASRNGPTLNPGDRLLFRAIGTTLELWRFDAGAWTRLLSVSDSTYQSAGYLILTARDSAVRLTNFGGGTLP